MAASAFRLIRLSNDCEPPRVDYFKSFGPDMAGEFTPDSAQAYLFPSFPDFVHAITLLWLTNGPADLFFEHVHLVGLESLRHG